MNAARTTKATGVSGARTVEQVGAFWDSHSLADHWGETRKALFEVRAARRRRVTIAPDLYAQVEAIAHTRGVSPETLVNLWLTEHVGAK
ncbi:MAG: hypothetical protein FJ291_00425 [Planctomycetes bacterium]|nr:hypothetical protein [Planctomycetota bacterium]